ncbi:MULTISPECIES: vitamin K epoxide reductase family protein [Prochlorococcus]|uniref:Uncharacterized conserved membrane protein n=1 Tax=Prochlorococcus marinus (strain SARG / CCMP1375 / SS120) TaxID=167539 RepID=Q7VE93_PROMA|nr:MULTISPECIES: vitamin K epoxide reductase family protein [Prochlorococcus]AAP99166.1 Uncharacterized conserved membrane protein [Prochlorococcus marinus subsp. marinus str. CCMP1375]KGG11564.1 Thioredoxin domain 2 [Prochlorococcus marinus str. LG]KGG18482.1 Thioredoxin domain 2 [Prochlorococcus marinus str. SS2]KGG22755.1 Thioredoxin domain 2 [Prochlorococcus marinus str. SS35]KGG32631.1 Thioredoxin domain 2 [Prochlorococcus marinus str. SS51]
MGTNRLKSRRRQDQGSKLARIFIAILGTIGVIDTGSITLERWGWINSLSCPGGLEGCDKVLKSAWGTIFAINGFEIPLSFVGFLSYLAILFLAIIPFSPLESGKKIDLSRNTWWGLFIISTCMTIFSFVLMGIMVMKIQAFCFFCILSAVISSLILILTIIGGGWEEKRDLLFRGLLITIVVLLGGLIWSSSVDPNKKETLIIDSNLGPIIENKSSLAAIELANHLKEKNIILYSAYWCPHCHDQKEMFGKEAASNLISIECAIDGNNSKPELCESKGITGFPSWEIKGKIESGVKSLDQLAELSEYKGSRDF